jgi:uncharacterized protein YeaO (DUF488 family)
MLQTKRVYDQSETSDGYRVLVDRLWPRGLTKEAAKLDEWLRDIAPSPDLRSWFGHDPGRWEAFVMRYRTELERPEAGPHLQRLADLARKGPVTLLYAAREERHNSASVLRDVLAARIKHRPRSATRAGR